MRSEVAVAGIWEVWRALAVCRRTLTVSRGCPRMIPRQEAMDEDRIWVEIEWRYLQVPSPFIRASYLVDLA